MFVQGNDMAFFQTANQIQLNMLSINLQLFMNPNH